MHSVRNTDMWEHNTRQRAVPGLVPAVGAMVVIG